MDRLLEELSCVISLEICIVSSTAPCGHRRPHGEFPHWANRGFGDLWSYVNIGLLKEPDYYKWAWKDNIFL
ncbi:unnamed protein product [Urochloa humidicola]